MELKYLTTEEWNELNVLREAITYDPASVIPEKQEKFTELFVKSLIGKGENIMYVSPTNY